MELDKTNSSARAKPLGGLSKRASEGVQVPTLVVGTVASES